MTLPNFSTIQRWLSQHLVHFSFKTTNTNIEPAGGVRIGLAQACDLPHVCARTALCESPVAAQEMLCGLDSIAGPSARVSGPSQEDPEKTVSIKSSDLLKAARFFRGEAMKMDAPPAVDPVDQKDLVAAYLEVASQQPAVINGGRLSARLRQILLPTADDYVAVTPLTSTGIGLAVNGAVRDRDEAFFASRKAKEPPATRRIARVSKFSVGGSNPQNAGFRVVEWARRPLVFDAVPSLDGDLRKFFRLAFSGFHFRLPVRLVADHQVFLGTLLNPDAEGSSSISWTVNHRDREVAYLGAIWRAIENQATSVRVGLERHDKALPHPLPALEKQPAFAGWIDLEKRSREWRESISLEVAQAIVNMVRSSAFSSHRVYELDDEDAQRISKTLAKGAMQ